MIVWKLGEIIAIFMIYWKTLQSQNLHKTFHENNHLYPSKRIDIKKSWYNIIAAKWWYGDLICKVI